MNAVKRTRSLYFRFFMTLAVAVAIAVVSFFALNRLYISFTEASFSGSPKVRLEANSLITGMQKRINAESLTTGSDLSDLPFPDKNRYTLSVSIFSGGHMIYCSDLIGLDPEDWSVYSKEDLTEYSDWNGSYTLHFSDGDTEAIVTAMIPYRYYSICFFAALISAFLIFFAIILTMIKSVINSLKSLARDVSKLEQGDLEHEIQSRTPDEIGYIAGSVDEMRKAIKKKIEEDAAADAREREIITEMSHDLRTPMTTLLLYSDFLKERKFEGEDQMWEYVDKINDKALQMKALSDEMFEYTRIRSLNSTELERGLFSDIFEPLFEDLAETLSAQGFTLDVSGDRPDAYLDLNPYYVMRIFSNLESNILKYADDSEPVRVRIAQSGNDAVTMTVSNAVSHEKVSKKTDSTGIGLANIDKMMRAMKGFSAVSDTENEFKVLLRFPCEKAE